MKTIFSLLIISSLFVSNLYGQYWGNITKSFYGIDVNEYNENNEVSKIIAKNSITKRTTNYYKSVFGKQVFDNTSEIIFYNKHGLTEKCMQYLVQTGKLSRSIEFEYDLSLNLSRIRIFNERNKLMNEISIRYQSNVLDNFVVYDSMGTISGKTKYIYNDTLLAKVTTVNEFNTETEEKSLYYNTSNKLVEIITVDTDRNNDKDISKIKYEYNAEGLIVKEILEYLNGDGSSKEIYLMNNKYDKSGKLIERIGFESNDENVYPNYTEKYEYLNNGRINSYFCESTGGNSKSYHKYNDLNLLVEELIYSEINELVSSVVYVYERNRK